MLYIGNQRYKPSGNTFKTSDLYDTEIEYLESNGTQLINTEIIGGTSCEYEIKMQLTANGNTYPHLCGANHPPTFPKILIALNNLSAEVKLPGESSSIIYALVTQTNRTVHTIEFKNGIILFDGVKKATLQPLGITDYPFCIFWYLAEPTTTKGVYGRIYYCKIWKDSELVRDLIPVRIGQQGYMYDKISKRLFQNIGKGQFILGPDKNQ